MLQKVQQVVPWSARNNKIYNEFVIKHNTSNSITQHMHNQSRITYKHKRKIVEQIPMRVSPTPSAFSISEDIKAIDMNSHSEMQSIRQSPAQTRITYKYNEILIEEIPSESPSMILENISISQNVGKSSKKYKEWERDRVGNGRSSVLKKILLNETENKVHEIFVDIDSKNNGLLDFNEFKDFFKDKFNLDAGSAKIEFDAIDIDRHGIIKYGEFRAKMMNDLHDNDTDIYVDSDVTAYENPPQMKFPNAEISNDVRSIIISKNLFKTQNDQTIFENINKKSKISILMESKSLPFTSKIKKRTMFEKKHLST